MKYNDELYFISETSITEETFKRQGWEKIEEKDDDDEYVYFILPIPKDNPDPNAPLLISSIEDEWKQMGVDKGQFLVELADYVGLGVCKTEEELELLYRVLTKRQIEE
jgi:hypothetical protein